jgi:hypothetical protein
MQKIKNKNVKWTPKDKLYNNNFILRKFTLKIYKLQKFQCTSIINFSFDDVFF